MQFNNVLRPSNVVILEPFTMDNCMTMQLMFMVFKVYEVCLESFQSNLFPQKQMRMTSGEDVDSTFMSIITERVYSLPFL